MHMANSSIPLSSSTPFPSSLLELAKVEVESLCCFSSYGFNT